MYIQKGDGKTLRCHGDTHSQNAQNFPYIPLIAEPIFRLVALFLVFPK